jgi:hypothetical protein
MAIQDHHLLCLGLLAKIGLDARAWGDTTLERSDLIAIRKAIASGQNLGLPVEVSEYDAGRAIHRDAKLLAKTTT